MGKNHGNRIWKIIILTLLSGIFFAVSYVPYANFAPGSFAGSVLTPAFGFLSEVIGFKGPYPLIGELLFCILLLFLCIIRAKKATFVSHLFLFAGMFLVFRDSSSFTLPEYFKAIGPVLIALYITWACLKLVKIFKNGTKDRKRTSKSEVKDIEIRETDGSLEFGIAVAGMKHNEAVEVLKSVTVPEFENYSNSAKEAKETKTDEYIVEEDNDSSDSSEETVVRSRIQEVFNPENLRKKLQEDQQGEFKFDGVVELSDTLDLPQEQEIQKTDTSVQPVENNVKKEPQFGEVRTREIEEQDDILPEDDDCLSDDDMNREKSTSSSLDTVSGVGGLKKAQGSDYYFNPKKYTYKFPSETYLKHYPASVHKQVDIETDIDGMTIVDTLSQFRIDTKLIGIQYGPTFTLYELVLAKGIRVNSVLGLADNIAMDLAVQSVRILAPIPGKTAIGIEVPNKKRDTIGFDDMMDALKQKSSKLRIPMVLGKTITGDKIVVDLASAPHMLIAGTTGSGKSVCVNSLICSVLFTKTPKEVRMILVDPKMVELTVYNDIPHLLTPVITDPKRAIKVMAFVVEEMQRRMAIFALMNVRKIEDYNQKIVEKNLAREKLPYIMVIVDEFADLMMVVGKELESYIKRITAVARFTGIHLVLATQRPSADVITGIIKSNMPTQIAFAVSNQINSRIILDSIGAEKLLGRGDMLYASASNRVPQRIQGAYIDQEIEQIVEFVKTQGQPDYIDESYFEDPDDEEETSNPTSTDSGEDMFTRAWKIVAERGEASASYLQRKLSIGYNRAATLIEQLEEAGYIGPPRGAKPREILRYPDGDKK